jgi:hypothetical protein
LARIVQEINLEVAKPNLFQAIVAKQSDYGSRYLKVTFVNNGEKINIEPTLTATINAERPDGASKRFDAVVNDDGTVTAPLTGWMLELQGFVSCDISVMTEDGRLTTTDFSINVNEAACSDGDISDDEDCDVLKELIVQVETLVEDIETKLENGDFKGEKGDKGDAGVIKFIPVNTLPTENIDENAIYLVPADNTDEQNIYEEFVYIGDMWESLGVVPVAIDLSDYVKNTQFADKNGNAGITRTKSIYGISSGRYNTESPEEGDTLTISRATDSEIEARKSTYKPIVPSNLDYAVKMALTDSKIEWAEEEKKAVRKLLGIVDIDDYLLHNYVLQGQPVPLPDVGALKEGDKYVMKFIKASYNNEVVIDEVEAEAKWQAFTPDISALCCRWSFDAYEDDSIYWVVLYNDGSTGTVKLTVWNGDSQIGFTEYNDMCSGDIVTIRKV